MEPVGVSWCRVRQLLKEWWKLRGLKARGGSPVAMEGGGERSSRRAGRLPALPRRRE